MLIDKYNASIDEGFQGRCLFAAREIARAIVAGETITNNSAVNLTEAPGSLNFAKRVLLGKQEIDKSVMAGLILQNSDVAANPLTSSEQIDDAIIWQTKKDWLTYIEIG
ncbi:MAG: hypothetical protein H6974_11020 [Gammaproteobacteria bacterium]|nr:hypothetical protein [Gammaproteobacteria bacterium]